MKLDHKDDFIILLEKKLKDATDERIKCEDKVSKLVEDLEKVRIENNELKTIKRIKKTVIKKTQGDETYDKGDEVELDSERVLLQGKQNGFRRGGPQVKSAQVFKCTKCPYSLKDKASLDEHIKNHEKLKFYCTKCGEKYDLESDLEFHTIYDHKPLYEWNCMQCSFQTNDKESLKKHFNLKHTERQDTLVCEKCSLELKSPWQLKNHIRDEHGKSEECFYFKDNRCRFGDRCWKKQSMRSNEKQSSSFVCYSCKENFSSLNNLMTHKKKEHLELCKPCSPKDGTCQFEDAPEKCWYIHKDFQEHRRKKGPP